MISNRGSAIRAAFVLQATALAWCVVPTLVAQTNARPATPTDTTVLEVERGDFVCVFDRSALDAYGVEIVPKSGWRRTTGDADADDGFGAEARDTQDVIFSAPIAPESRLLTDGDGAAVSRITLGLADGTIASDGALRLLRGDLGVLLLHPTLVRDSSGRWVVRPQNEGANPVGNVFEARLDAATIQRTTNRFRIRGDLIATTALADTLGVPNLAGVVVGRLIVDGALGRPPTPDDGGLAAPGRANRIDLNAGITARDSEDQRNLGQSTQLIGSDVIVWDLYQLNNYGVVGSTAALSVGTISCNIGDRNASWIANTNQHPVIGQNMYRLKDDRFEQIGMSWLKHAFFAVNGTSCSVGCQGTNGTALGVLCSDPYSASLNGTQSNLGPRYQVNPNTGDFPYPPANPPYSGLLPRRLQVAVDDLDQSINQQAEYFVEGQYILPDDAAWGTADNNVSYRPVDVAGAGSSVFAQLTDATFPQDPAILAWKRADSSVVEEEIRVPSDGLFTVAAKVRTLPGGFWAYEYAVYNMNVHRAAGSFRVPVDPNSTIRNVGFHDVDYHSGEPFAGTDWAAAVSSVSLTWSSESFAQNQNANALRWGTLYNFRFEIDAPPQATVVRLGLFRPGDPDFVEGTSIGPITNTSDCNSNEVPDSIDIANGTSVDCDGDNIPDECEAFAIEAVRVASGLDQPVYVTSPPNDATRLFIVEQSGRIKILENASVLATPFLDITDRVSSGGERGLLGLAFDPNYSVNRRFYVNYTNLLGDTVLARFTTSTDPNLASASSEVILKTIAQDGPAHNGGQLQFSPDGMLYVGMADGAVGGDPNGRAQDTGSLLGKMLRLDVNAPPDYIPADNPFLSTSLPLDEIWALGLQNPSRFSFDRETGDLYLTDVGESALEEINVASGEDSGGSNYGWRCMEGTTCTGLSGCTCDAPSLTLPTLTYPTGGGDCTITGGYVYRGCAIPNLLGTYFYADYCSGTIRSFRLVNGTVTEQRDRTAELTPTTGAITTIVSFGEGADGELYVVSDGGDIYKIIPRDVPPDVCGNGVLELDESCDDGNLVNGDGCDALCQIEPGLMNDACADALTIGDETVVFDTSDATTDGPDEPAACDLLGDSQVGSDIWYRYDATCTGSATLSLCGSAYNTKLAVYEGMTCPVVGGPLACDDNACGLQSQVTIPVDACAPYLVRVGGYLGATGTGTLSVSCLPDPIVDDCNANGVEDASDIACATSTDGNGNGVPDECETTGDPITGGRLYDRWWQELTITPPSTDHPLWVYRPDMVSNTASGATTWRCKECHGWDYKGLDGQYGIGSHRTGFPGVLGSALDATDMFVLLKEPPNNAGDPGVLNGHDFGTVLSDPQINDLVAFVLSGAIDDGPFIAGSGDFAGDPIQGEVSFQTGGTIPCMTCHGSDGTTINFGTFEAPSYLGTVAVTNPWEMLHKIRFGQPAAPMPSWLAGGGQTQGAANIGRYIQLNLPTECVDDLQCSDGIACTVDTCGSDGRCVFTPTDSLCADDGVFCNGPEVCDVAIGCVSFGNPCSAGCDEALGCGCAAPVVEATGNRYLAITPQPSGVEIPSAILVEPLCPLGVAKYLGAPLGPWNIATLVDDPAEAAHLTPSEWGGTVYVSGTDIVPDQLYEVRTDCGAPGSPVLLAPVEVETGLFGDVTGPNTGGGSAPPDGRVDFTDISAVVAAFQQDTTAPSLYRADIYGCVPDQIVDFVDISGTVDAFVSLSYRGSSLCPGPCW